MPASGGRSVQPVRIFHALQVRGTGERALAEVAAVQSGRLHRDQLIAAGFSRWQISNMVRRVRLLPIYPRVYALGHAAAAPLADEVAAMLYVGHDAAISHRTAASIWGFAPRGDEVDVTLMGRDSRRCGPIVTYRVPQLDSRDVRLRQGLPVTAPARTLIDLAATATVPGLGSAAAEARAKRLVTDPDFDAALQRAPLRTGTRAFKALRATPAGRLLTRSRLERDLIALLTAAGLPLPLTNVRVNGHEVDGYWPDHKLVLEVDSWLYHGSREAFGRDRKRDQDQLGHRVRVIRVTDEQLLDEPLHVAARIAEALVQNA
jgi:hypothetical protein